MKITRINIILVVFQFKTTRTKLIVQCIYMAEELRVNSINRKQQELQ